MTLPRPILLKAIIGLIVAVSASMSLAMAADSRLAFEPTPDWTTRLDLPPLEPPQAERALDGVYYVLFDTQVRIQNQSYDYYRRSARRVTNRTGLEEAGRLQFSFDPADETFIIHAVRILRDGDVINRLDTDAFSVVHQERDLSDGVTNGRLTAYYELPDVRVGDVVEYEISWRTASEIWPGEYFDDFSVEWSVPVGRTQTRVLAPTDRAFYYKSVGEAFEPVVSTKGAFTEYLWARDEPPIVAKQQTAPATFANWSYVSASTIENWRDVVASLVDSYDAHLELPDDFADTQAWFGGERSTNEKITEAIRYVQNEIRYVGDEAGVGSHLPRAPKTVIERGWGDCKDKSLLLVAILRALNVDAYVALTDNDSGYALEMVSPSPFAFDHAIAVIETEKGRVWVDPTDSQQGGVFPNIAQPAYGFGLALYPGNEQLWKIDVSTPDHPQRTVDETFDFAELTDEGIAFVATSIYLGGEADRFRYRLAGTSLAQLSDDYLTYYRDLYPGLKKDGNIQISDNFDANKIIVVERYRLAESDFRADDLYLEFPLQADTIRSVLKSVQRDDRRAPIALPFPKNLQHIVTLKNTGIDMSGIDAFDQKTPEFEHSRASESKNDSVTITYRLKTNASAAPLERLGAYNKVAEEASDWGYVTYNLDTDETMELSFEPEELTNAGFAFLGALVVFLIGAGVIARMNAG